MKVLVLGGCGYVGSALCPYLKTNGIEVFSVDLEWFGNPANIPNRILDMSDILDISHIMPLDYDAIVLLAGHSSVKMCLNNLLPTFKNNVQNFVELLGKVKKGTKFIYASSSSVYGKVNRSIMDENCIEYVCSNYYDFSKFEIDSYMKMNQDVEYYGLRFGTINGFSHNFRNDIMLNSMYATAMSDKEIRVNNLQVRRPILGMYDLCKAILTILKKGSFEKRGIYNLASFNGSVDAISQRAAKILEVPVRYMTDTDAYDFAISTGKFENTFKFNFVETVDSILFSITENKDNLVMSNRNQPKFYD